MIDLYLSIYSSTHSQMVAAKKCLRTHTYTGKNWYILIYLYIHAHADGSGKEVLAQAYQYLEGLEQYCAQQITLYDNGGNNIEEVMRSRYIRRLIHTLLKTHTHTHIRIRMHRLRKHTHTQILIHAELMRYRYIYRLHRRVWIRMCACVCACICVSVCVLCVCLCVCVSVCVGVRPA